MPRGLAKTRRVHPPTVRTPQLYSPTGLDLKPVKIGPEGTFKPGCSGDYSHYLGNLAWRMIGELLRPVLTNFRSSPIRLYSWGVNPSRYPGNANAGGRSG